MREANTPAEQGSSVGATAYVAVRRYLKSLYRGAIIGFGRASFLVPLPDGSRKYVRLYNAEGEKDAFASNLRRQVERLISNMKARNLTRGLLIIVIESSFGLSWLSKAWNESVPGGVPFDVEIGYIDQESEETQLPIFVPSLRISSQDGFGGNRSPSE